MPERVDGPPLIEIDALDPVASHTRDTSGATLASFSPGGVGVWDGTRAAARPSATPVGRVPYPPRMTDRMRRVNEAVRAVVAEAVGDLKDPRIGLVTVTGVQVTPDLREAMVFVSVLGGERKRRASLTGLESAHGVLQARVARELKLKRTPQLSFAYDPSVEQGVRMTKLIDELATDLLDVPDDEPGDDHQE